jgi:hypothetical protein
MFIISIFYAVNRIGSFRKRFTLNPDIANVFCCHWEQSSSFSAARVAKHTTDIKIDDAVCAQTWDK